MAELKSCVAELWKTRHPTVMQFTGHSIHVHIYAHLYKLHFMTHRDYILYTERLIILQLQVQISAANHS